MEEDNKKLARNPDKNLESSESEGKSTRNQINYLDLDASKKPRQGWEKQCQEAGAGNEDLLMGDYLHHSFDCKEWTWD